MLAGRVLRSRSVLLVEQEIQALLIVEQLLRTVMSEAANTVPHLDSDRVSFTIALHTVRDLVLAGPPVGAAACGVSGWARLAGEIGQGLTVRLLEPKRIRSGPRTVKRSNSKYQARATSTHGPTLPATISIDVLAGTGELTAQLAP